MLVRLPMNDTVGEPPPRSRACHNGLHNRLNMHYDIRTPTASVCRSRQKQEYPMSMQPQLFYLIPAETERVALASFPTPSAIMRIRDELGMLFSDRDFAA